MYTYNFKVLLINQLDNAFISKFIRSTLNTLAIARLERRRRGDGDGDDGGSSNVVRDDDEDVCDMKEREAVYFKTREMLDRICTGESPNAINNIRSYS